MPSAILEHPLFDPNGSCVAVKLAAKRGLASTWVDYIHASKMFATVTETRTALLEGISSHASLKPNCSFVKVN